MKGGGTPAGAAIGIALALLVLLAAAGPAAAAVSNLRMTGGTGSDVAWRGDVVFVSGSSEPGATITFTFTDTDGDSFTVQRTEGLRDSDGDSGEFQFQIDFSQQTWTGGNGELSTGTVTVEATEESTGSTASTTFMAEDSPDLESAQTVDSDGDGVIDQIVVQFNEPVHSSHLDAGDFTLSSGSVDSASMGQTNSKEAVLGVSGFSGTGATPDVTVAPESLGDPWDNTGPTTETTVTATDGATPVVESVVTSDADGNGQVDSVDVTLSETIDASTVEASDFSLATAGGYTGSGITGVGTAAGNDAVIRVALAEGTTPDTDATPELSYTKSGSTDVADSAGHQLADFTTTATDAAAPVLTQAEWKDTDGNGDIDETTLTFSERVDVSDGGTDDGFPALTIRDANDNPHTVDTGTYSPSSTATLTLPFAGDQIDTTAIAGLTIGYSTGTSAHIVEASADGTNDEMADGTDVALSNVDSANPVIDAVATGDTDTNGKVDRLDVKLSEPIERDTLEAGDFTISAANGLAGTKSGVDTASSGDDDTIHIAITEGSTPDTDATPDVTYESAPHLQDLNGNPLATTTLTATDAAAPAIVGASTGDADADGDVDTIDVTLSEPLDDSTSTFDTTTFSLSNPSGSVTGVSTGATDDDGATMTVGGITGTGVTPDVTLASDKLYDIHDNALAGAQTFTGTGDGAAPVVETVLTRDIDANGRIDRLDVTLSETIDHTTVQSGDFSLSASVYTGDGIQGVTTDPESTNSKTLHVALAESPETHDTGATPDLTYTQSGSTDVADLAGNVLGDVSSGDVSETDGASPVVTQATWKDTESTPNGDIDTVTLTFSETVDALDSGSNDGFPAMTIEDASGTAHSIDTGTYTPSSTTTLTLPFTNDQIDTTATTGLTVGYATGTTAHVVEKGGFPESSADSTNDEVDSGADVALSNVDSAEPIIESVVTHDTDTNGKVDQLGVTFSESIDSASVETGDFSISNAGGLAGTLGSVTTATGSGDTLHVAITESTGTDPYDTDATPTLDYSTEDSDSTDVADLAGNLLASTTKTATDGAAPAVVGATTGDSNADGDVDTIGVTLSEPLDDSTSAFTDAFSLSTGSVGSVDTGTEGDDAVTLTASNIDGTGVTPDVTLAADKLHDTHDNALTGAQTFTGTDDGAAPVIDALVTGDADRDGFLDRLRVTLSEPLDDSTVQPDDFSIASPNGYSGTGVPQGGVGTGTRSGDDALLVTLAEGSTPDTSATPELAYAQSGSTDLADPAGNLLADASVVATDGAAPAIVGAKTGDSNADGNVDTIDVTLSEPLDDSTSTFGSAFSLSAGTVDSAGTETGGDATATMTVSGISGTSATPDVTLEPETLADAGGNTLASAQTYTGTVDGAAPVVWTISTIDADADGNVDGATVAASEHVDDGTLSPSGWSMGGKSVEAVDTGSTAHDETFRVRFTSDGKEFDGTAVTPDVIYSGGSVADPAGNLLRDLASDDVSETDGADPKVTSVSARNPSGQTVEFSVTSGERLDAIEAAVSGPESATLTEFTESGSGPYTYTATYEADSGGTYTVALARAADAAGNDGASGQSDSANVPESLEEETTTTTTSSGGGGGDSGGFSTTTTTTTTTTSTPTPTETKTETPTPTPSEPTVDVVRSTSGDEATVDVSDPYAGEPVAIPGDDSGPLVSSRNVTVDSLDVTVGDGRDYTMNLSLTDTVPGSTPPLGTQTGQTSLGYLDVDHTATNVTGSTIRFRVNRSVLEELGVNDSAVTLYRDDNGTWAPVETLSVGGNETHAAYTADTARLDTFAFGVPTSQFVVRSITLESATIQTGETATIRATIANTGEKDATHAARLYAGGEYVRTVSVTIPAGERRTVTFEPTFEEPGSYPLAVNSYIGPTLTVESTATTTSDGTNQSNLSSLVAVLPAWLWLVLFFVIVGLVAAAIERWSHN